MTLESKLCVWVCGCDEHEHERGVCDARVNEASGEVANVSAEASRSGVNLLPLLLSFRRVDE